MEEEEEGVCKCVCLFGVCVFVGVCVCLWCVCVCGGGCVSG